MHRREKHPLEARTGLSKYPTFIGHGGIERCAKRHGCKRVYRTIDDAWRETFLTFSDRGHIVTPYRCTTYQGSRGTVPGCDRWHVSTKAALLPGRPIVE